nr:PREDICTED: uncharacterized protein LOC103313617 [Tribolium castaneum]|eukprot:XP_015837726.1 PREDICTED: uncharacterized protein LOC103313617 [Tribolium castaneum]
MKRFLFLLLILALKPSKCFKCAKSGLVCVDSNNFQECQNVRGQYVLVGSPMSCGNNRFCDDSSRSIECVSTPPITSPTLITIPTCNSADTYPAQTCNQYYKCILVMSWYYAPELKDCPNGQAYDIYLKTCAPVATVDCQIRTRTTVILPTTVLNPVTTSFPKILCTKIGLVCIDSQRFQKCGSIEGQFVLIGNFMSCPDGQICDDSSDSIQCVTNLPVSAITPITIPTCTSIGKYPSETCNKYYECILVMSWYYAPELKSCPIGEAYDINTEKCALRHKLIVNREQKLVLVLLHLQQPQQH